MRVKYLHVPFTLSLGLVLALLWLLGSSTAPATAVLTLSSAEGLLSDATPIHYVTTTGTDSGDCSTPTGACRTVQYAVDWAGEGDEVRVATGVYTGVSARAGVTQVVYITKTVTVRGGYTTTDWSTSNPISYPTTLDAQGEGRVIYITGDISPTVEGLRITGGDAEGLGGYQHPLWPNPSDAGGGIYIKDATAIISNNWIFSSSAGIGGGLFLLYSGATLSGNTVTTSTANLGGGLGLMDSDATLKDNTVTANRAGRGGGLYICRYSDATLEGNTVTANSADYGGGLNICWISGVTLSGNTVFSNTAAYDGGGLCLNDSAVTLSGNTVTANRAGRDGGGLYLWGSYSVLDNNFVTDNGSSSGHGSGLYMYASSPQLRHNTIARNHGGGGEGLYVTGAEEPSQPQLYNTILVSHTMGVCAMAGNTVTLEATLWGTDTWANDTDWDCDGTVITGSVNVWGDPAFVNPDAEDYHIGPGSAAVDAGVNSSLDDDVDGEPRPMAFGPDIGADEHLGPGLQLHKRAPLRYSFSAYNPGRMVTYTLVVTGIGAGPVDDVILADTLPPEQRVVASAASTGDCVTDTTPVWGGQVVCTLGTLDVGDSARITLTARTTTTTFLSTLPRRMRNRVWVTGTQASDYAYADVYLQDCHARLNDGLNEWDDVQTAVDASTRPTDVVKVAGVCAGISTRGDTRQVAYISKTVTIRGGYSYSPANWTTPDPAANPTTLHAAGRGRVFYITGDINPTVEGLRITGGDADGLGGYTDRWGGTPDTGGGIYIIGAAAIISNNQVFSNTADGGGGLYLWRSGATLNGNTVTANTAHTGGGLRLTASLATLSGNTVTANTAGWGGGLYLSDSAATLSGNTVTANTARWWGGGLHLTASPAVLSGNTVAANTAHNNGGGGLYLSESAATLSDNTVTANTAGGSGGGLRLNASPATLSGNTVFSNTVAYDGGGLYLNGSAATLSGNTVFSNTAVYQGGGLYLWYSAATLSGNTVIANTAGSGGGLSLYFSDSILTNNVVADNRVDSAGSGLYVAGSAPHLLHTTIARNSGGDGTGLHATNAYRNGTHYGSVTLTNTILVSHMVGVCAMAGNTVTLEATLWGNDTDWDCDGAVITGSINTWGDPAFVAPDAGDYHIGPNSAAIDAGVNATVTSDMDGDSRPMGHGYDVGADELRIALAVSKQATPDPVVAGAQLTFTLHVTNTGDLTLTAIITDMLPGHVTPTGVLTWMRDITAPGDVWMEQFAVTVVKGYSGTLTNVVHVATYEGATGIYTATSTVVPPIFVIYLPLVMRNY